MAEPKNTMPEAEFMKSLEMLEKLSKGLVPDGNEENLEKGGEVADPAIPASPAPAAEEPLKKGGDGDGKDGDDDDDGDDDGDGDGGGGADDDDEDLDKALKTDKPLAEQLAEGSESIRKAIEVSDFLEDLVKGVCSAVDAIREAVAARLEAMEKSMVNNIQRDQRMEGVLIETLKKSFQAVSAKADNQAEELRKSIETVGTELGKLPARAPKARTTVLEKSFTDGDDGQPKTTKNDILKSLSAMVEKGDPEVSPMDVIRFEGSGTLSPKLRQKLGL